MKILPKRKLTDAEFVEKIRKQTQSARRRAWFLLGFSILYLALIPGIWLFARESDFVQTRFANGYFVGFFTGVFLFNAVIYFAFFTNHLFGYRKEKLLVAYYDRLHSANK